MDALQQGMVVIDSDWRIVEVNRGLCEITGYSERDFVGAAPPYPSWTEAAHETLRTGLEEVRAGGTTSREVVLERRCGERYPALIQIARIDDPQHRESFIAILRDLTEERTAQERLTEAHTTARLTSWDWDPRSDRLRFASQPLLPLRDGMSLEAVLRNIPEPYRTSLNERIQSALERGVSFRAEHPLNLPGGRQAWIESHFRPVPAGDHPGFILRGTSQDITARHLAEEESHFRARLLDEVNAAVIATDLDGSVQFWNRAAEELYGYSREEAVGRAVSELIVVSAEATVPASAESDESGSDGTERDGTGSDGTDARGRSAGLFDVRRRDGTTFPAFIRDVLVHDANGEPSGVIGVSVDVTERVEFERRLQHGNAHLRAITDSMGEGLFTLDVEGRLTYMNRAAERMLGLSRSELKGQLMHYATHAFHEDGSPYPAVDCPIFNAHSEGRIARVEDDVFFRADGSALPVEYTAAPFHTEDGVEGCVVVFEDITKRKAEQERLRRELTALTWARRIREALDQQRFVLYAQPIVELASGRVVQHELLIRMRDENDVIITPGEFLPIAEQYGLIRHVDRWVVREACRIAAGGTRVEVNLSAQSIGDRKLAAFVEAEILAAGADPTHIVFELTETALIQDEQIGAATIRELASLGCRIALDDFGTGYGGLRYLKHLPLHLLKIDTEFVRDIIVNPASENVVKSVVALARAFGQQTVAEGVEDQETLELLRTFGVDYVQGYHLGRPAPLVGATGGEAPQTAGRQEQARITQLPKAKQ